MDLNRLVASAFENLERGEAARRAGNLEEAKECYMNGIGGFMEVLRFTPPQHQAQLYQNIESYMGIVESITQEIEARAMILPPAPTASDEKVDDEDIGDMTTEELMRELERLSLPSSGEPSTPAEPTPPTIQHVDVPASISIPTPAPVPVSPGTVVQPKSPASLSISSGDHVDIPVVPQHPQSLATTLLPSLPPPPAPPSRPTLVIPLSLDVVIRYTYGDVTVSIPDPIGSPAASPSTAYSGVSAILTARSGATVSKCTREGVPVLLQEMKLPLSHVQNFSESLRRVVKLTRTQVAVPALLSVAAVFFGDVAVDVYGPAVKVWLEMATNASNHDVDLSRCVTLSSWLGDVTGGSGAPTARTSRSPWEVQSVFQQIFQALAALHAAGLVGCLHPDAILLCSSSSSGGVDWRIVMPAVCCGSYLGDTLPPDSPRSPSALLPSVFPMPEASPEADIYVLGCLLHKAYTGRYPVLLPGRDGVEVATQTVGSANDERLIDLLSRCLRRDASLRTTAPEAAIHPYFTTSFVTDFIAGNFVVAVDKKRTALFSYVNTLRDTGNRFNIKVKRTDLVQSALTAIMAGSKAQLVRRFSVGFEGEQGIDAGGLTSELYQLVFDMLCSGDVMLMVSPDGGGVNPTYLPATDEDVPCDDATLKLYEGIGRFIVKSIFDGQPVPARFSPYLFKFLLELEPNLNDLEAFDTMQAVNLRKLYFMTQEEIDFLCLNFEDFGGPDAPVTVENRSEYIAKRVKWILKDCRIRHLNAIKKGFEAIDIKSHLVLFSYTELMSLLCGQQYVKPADLVKLLKFERFSTTSTFPGRFRELLSSFSSEDCKRFLVFITAQSALPVNKTIDIRKMDDSTGYPRAHTCFNRLDVPEYDSDELLRQRIRFCLDNLEIAGFGES